LGNTALMTTKSAKTPKNSPSRKKVSAPKKAVPKRMTVAVLAENLKTLETRLKNVNSKNQKALKSLETALTSVKRKSSSATAAQKLALRKGLSSLEIQVETYLERAANSVRSEIRSDLAGQMTSGANLTTLNQAVNAANARLDVLDNTQRDAVARMNRHIAALATSLERRLEIEARARKNLTEAFDTKIDTVRQSFESRVEKVEQDTAVALTAVGDKITEFAAALEERAKSSDVDTAERLADLAQETQSDFSTVNLDVAARLDALEMIASTWTPEDTRPSIAANPYLPANEDDPRIDQMGEMIETMQQELRQMHARMTSEPPASPVITPPSNVVAMSNTIQPTPENPYASAARALEVSAAEIETDSPQSQVAPAQSAPDSHIPQEFDPAAFTSAPQAAMPNMAPMQVPPPSALSAPPPSLPHPPLAPPMASANGFAPPAASTESMSEFQGGEPLMPAPLPLSTYNDPAYAEGDDMRAERIGEAITKRKTSAKPMLTGRNVRVGVLALGVSLLGLFAAKTILGGSDGDISQVNAPTLNSTVPATVQSAALSRPAEVKTQVNDPTPPTGQYTDMQAPTLEAAGQNSLDAAVSAGNPIAQFQKGLVQLQAGQMEEGARLIRLSANRNQPAAQYRLAKLYESGTGIAKDMVTARELIERAAAGGNRIAMHDLGNYHAYGQGGLDQDMGAALDWFTKAAERGVVDSQFNVAFLREGNEGVPADLETALFWYHVAARQGDQGAPDRIKVLGEQVDLTAMTDIRARAERFNPKPVDEAANGIFRDVPWSKKPSVQPRTTSAEIVQIRDAQTLLGSLGYDVGTADGVVGSKTRKAVKSFEAVNGMPETGRITEELIQKLEIATGA